MIHDIAITGGLVYDGSGTPPRPLDIAVTKGRIVAMVEPGTEILDARRTIDAERCWVMPGFIDVHTHYDAEIVADPALRESVRHGVTTVITGNCSLSMITVDPTTAADLFARVEAIPHDGIEAILDESRSWTTPSEYRSWIDRQPLGPNVAAMLGHSDIRAAVMGLRRATRAGAPTPSELAQMKEILESALDAGFLGLSTMTATLDKVAGDVAWSQPLPSTFASWREYRHLHRVLRRRGRVLQSAPNAQTLVNVIGFMAETMGILRRPLRTSLLTALDLKANRLTHILTRLSGHVANTMLRGELRWQALPGPLTIMADGVEFSNFEEFASGRTLRDLRSASDQYALLSDPDFQKAFIKDMGRFVVSGLWHRRVDDARIVSCPDPAITGRTFGEIARETGRHPAREFLRLAALHRDSLRWTTTLGNDRPAIMRALLASPVTQIGFADSGAHIRNMAMYNFGLRALKVALDDRRDSVHPAVTVEQMVRKLTSDPARWWGIEAGVLSPGHRADIVVVDPERLDRSVFEVTEAFMPAYGLNRVVNRSDGAVRAVLVNGRVAFLGDQFVAGFGSTPGFGRFLASTHS